MKKIWLFELVAVLFLAACTSPSPVPSSTPTDTSTPTSTPDFTTTPVADSANPCIEAPPPARWNYIVVLMFENKSYDEVIGPAPYITSLADRCATAPDWHDADTRVDGSHDGRYPSKPGYATLTNGLPPSVHGLTNDAYRSTTEVNNIYHQLSLSGLSFKDYYEAEAGGCGVRFSGDYHDPIRYYTNVADICNSHDVSLSTFMEDVNSGNLPAFSMILPSNEHNMHNNRISSGDDYAKSLLEPLLDSQAYASGSLAIFFLWDESTPIPNVILAPSIVPGTKITVPSGNPISHFSALRTWEEMLGLPLLGDVESAPSILPFLEGRAQLP